MADHYLQAYYLGWTGDGHIGWLNIDHAFYQVLGEDSLNGIAGQRVDINAQMARARVVSRQRLDASQVLNLLRERRFESNGLAPRPDSIQFSIAHFSSADRSAISRIRDSISPARR